MIKLEDLRNLPNNTLIVGIYNSDKGEENIENYINAHKEWGEYFLLDATSKEFPSDYLCCCDDPLYYISSRKAVEKILDRFNDEELDNHRKNIHMKNSDTKAEEEKFLNGKELERDFEQYDIDAFLDYANFGDDENIQDFIDYSHYNYHYAILIIENDCLGLSKYEHENLSEAVAMGNAEIHVISSYYDNAVSLYVSEQQAKILKTVRIRTDW